MKKVIILGCPRSERDEVMSKILEEHSKDCGVPLLRFLVTREDEESFSRNGKFDNNDLLRMFKRFIERFIEKEGGDDHLIFVDLCDNADTATVSPFMVVAFIYGYDVQEDGLVIPAPDLSSYSLPSPLGMSEADISYRERIYNAILDGTGFQSLAIASGEELDVIGAKYRVFRK
jgi:hypothetical protein